MNHIHFCAFQPSSINRVVFVLYWFLFIIPYFSTYKTILLSKIFKLKIESRLIHGSKLRRKKQVEGKAGIKVILQGFDSCFPLYLLSLSKRKAGIRVLQDRFNPCFPFCLLSPMGLSKRRGKGNKPISRLHNHFDPFPPYTAMGLL